MRSSLSQNLVVSPMCNDPPSAVPLQWRDGHLLFDPANFFDGFLSALPGQVDV